MPLSVGIPKEIKPLEKRVGMNPEGVAKLVQSGIPVVVQSQAGSLSGFKDDDYQKGGAYIAADLTELYGRAEFIQKVKEPQPEEYSLLQKKHVLFCFLHLASPEHCDLVRHLVKTGLTAIGFETIKKDSRLPILHPMSEIAGGLAALYAAYLRSVIPADFRPGSLFQDSGFRRNDKEDGILSQLEIIAQNYPRHSLNKSGTGLDNRQDLSPLGSVIIFGAGIAGMQAYKLSAGIANSVCLVEQNLLRLEALKKRGIACVSPQTLTRKQLEDADVLIGCAHSPGQRAAQVMTKEMLRDSSRIKKKSSWMLPSIKAVIFPIPIPQLIRIRLIRMSLEISVLMWPIFHRSAAGVPRMKFPRQPWITRTLCPWILKKLFLIIRN